MTTAEILIATLVPVASALLGGLFGFLGARWRLRADERMNSDEIAASLVEREWERLSSVNERSEFSAIATWAVLRKLIDEYNSRGFQLRDLEGISDKMDSQYASVCATFYGFHLLDTLTRDLDEAGVPKNERMSAEALIRAQRAFIRRHPYVGRLIEASKRPDQRSHHKRKG